MNVEQTRRVIAVFDDDDEYSGRLNNTSFAHTPHAEATTIVSLQP